MLWPIEAKHLNRAQKVQQLETYRANVTCLKFNENDLICENKTELLVAQSHEK